VDEETGALTAKFSMVEFPTSSAQASGEFLHRLFGFDTAAYGPDYTDVDMGDGHSLGFQSAQDEAPSGPLVVFQVNDLDAARRAVIDAGGQVTVEPFDFPGGRRFQFREPGGNELAIWTPTRPSE
jgi:predicted enzyme related to lactoylglutathione lyase